MANSEIEFTDATLSGVTVEHRGHIWFVHVIEHGAEHMVDFDAEKAAYSFAAGQR